MSPDSSRLVVALDNLSTEQIQTLCAPPSKAALH